MAGSRWDRIGNIFSRTTGLIRSGGLRYEDRPLWYDAYRIFPPKYEPRYQREIDPALEVRPIFYEEDLVRSRFFHKYGQNPGGRARNLNKYGEEDDCQRFVLLYNNLKKDNPSWTHKELMEASTSKFIPSTSYSSGGQRGDGQEDIGGGPKRLRRIRTITQSNLAELFQSAKDEIVSDEKATKK